MKIDKRYIEILAEYSPHKSSKWYGKIALLSFVILIAGIFLLSNSLQQPINSEADKQSALTMMYTGMGVAAASTVLLGAATVLKTKEKKRSRREFLDYCEKYDALPPWPEEIKPARPPQERKL